MGRHKTVSALLAAGADVNVQDREQRTPLHLAVKNDHHETVSALLAAGADVNVQDRQGFTPLQHATEKGHSKCVVLLQIKADKGGQKKVLDTILSQIGQTDVRLLARVWSARTGKLEIPGTGVSTVLIRDMMNIEYITSGNLRMLEKDMMTAGISFPAIVRHIPGVPEEFKYSRTTEAAVGPTGGELEIPGFVKLVVPQGVLQQETMITISTVDVAAILRDPANVNWLSGYPWSLGEDVCPRQLLDQVLFSPAVDVNLHGAQLNGPVEVQTWRPPGSEGMEPILLKHHDEEGWTNITALTSCHFESDRLSMLIQSFSPVVTLWAPVEIMLSVGNMLVSNALPSRTLNCRFAAYINPSLEDVQFHVVCRDKRVETDENLRGFTKCGGNAAMFHLFHGDVLDITVRIRGGQNESKQIELQSEQCRDKIGQNVQFLLNRPNGNRVKGDVDVKKVQVPTNRTVCQFIFKEEGDILQKDNITSRRTVGPQKRSSDNLPPASVAGKKRRGSESQQRDDEAGPSGVERDTGPTADMDACFEKVIAGVSSNWDTLAGQLGFSQNQIDGIYDSKIDHDRRCRKMLNMWRNREGRKATLQVLKQALIDIDERLTEESL